MSGMRPDSCTLSGFNTFFMNKKKRVFFFALTLFVLFAIIYGAVLYNKIYGINAGSDEDGVSLFVPTGASYEDVLDSLVTKGLLRNVDSFDWVARKKGYPEKVRPGHYIVERDLSNNSLVNMLRAGLQTPVNVVITNARTIADVAGRISQQLEADSASIMNLLNDQDYIAQYGFDRYTIPALFIPNTYEFWWNTAADELIERMDKEYKAFWNNDRLRKASAMNMKPVEVVTLASIVSGESNKYDEYATIAGLYINRLNKGMRLQADPTVIFALGDFTRRRVLKEDTMFDSPYNTYLYGGLPPGPINMPSIRAVDAVLDHEQHDYLYLCAKDDFSGYHVFAETLAQHNRNARLYQLALNRQNILR